MKRFITLVFSALCSLSYGYAAQSSLSVEECQQMAQKNYPYIRHYELVDRTEQYTIANANRGYIPQLTLGAKASYQSDVTSPGAAAPGGKKMDKDQYSVTLDLNQTIWDGGVISSHKKEASSLAEVARKEVKVELYALNERVNQLFFGILLLESQILQNALLQQELERNHRVVVGYIENGVGNRSDLDVVRVEQLKAQQSEVTLSSAYGSYRDMLGILIGQQLDEQTLLETPLAIEPREAQENNRPELEMFDAQYSDLEGSKRQVDAYARPKLGLFVTGGYGRPALNMLNTEFDTYYVAGVRLTWNFGSLYTKKSTKQLIETNQRRVMVARETFLFNTSMQLATDRAEIEKQRELLRSDDEIVALRGRIKQATESKLLNGTITVNDYMIEVTAEDMAKQQRILHEIELLHSIYNLKYRTNN